MRFEWDWTIRIGIVLGLAGLYYQVFYGFIADFNNYPKYFLALLGSVIFGIIITYLLENYHWNVEGTTPNPVLEVDSTTPSEIQLLTWKGSPHGYPKKAQPMGTLKWSNMAQPIGTPLNYS